MELPKPNIAVIASPSNGSNENHGLPNDEKDYTAKIKSKRDARPAKR